MKYKADSKYWDLYEKLDPKIKALAKKSFELLKTDIHHPSLKLKKLERSGLWSARVGPNYRVLGVAMPDQKGIIWIWIGSHEQYNTLLKGRKVIADISNFHNWVKLTPEQIKQEYEWEYLAHVSHKWKLFKDFEDFKDAVLHAKVLILTPQIDHHVANRSHTSSIEELKDMTSNYRFPRDVDRIVQGFKTNAKMPMPLLLKLPGNQLYIMSGNTRTDAAFILGITPKVLVIDVSDKMQKR
jgi:mRNA-degrading endonuclease RelE of RelBE toxin-antitoxin system